jgi:hypothetical protein
MYIGKTIFFFYKMEPSRLEIDVKWNSKTHFKNDFRFFEPFHPIFDVKLVIKAKENFPKNSIWVSQNAKFDAKFKSVERSTKNHPKIVIRPKTFAHSKKSKKTQIFCHFFSNNFFRMSFLQIFQWILMKSASTSADLKPILHFLKINNVDEISTSYKI